ncbi:MAG: ABC transporter permease subunit [Rhodobiaceae bacterium]|nr:ABC transporter permease subunit [Rhodobiaceae bacterium]
MSTALASKNIGTDVGAMSRRQGAFALVALALVLAIGKFALPAALIRPPEWLVLPFADWINAAFAYVRDDLGLMHVTRAFAAGVEWLLDVTANLLYGKNRWPRIGPVPWTAVAISAFMLGYALKGWRLGLLAGGTFVWIAVFGQWKWAMETLSVIVVAAPIAIAFGLALGIAAWRRRWVEKTLSPILNIAQSLPHFAYMIPVVVFIGVGPKAGAIVTIIFATPPMIRMTLLGLKKVPPEVVENGHMCGATRGQLLRHVRLPTARTEILIGVNQVIMQCLAMVVLASFIGMPGLGQKLLQLLQALKIGRSVEIGITIVLVAVTLDRCSKAWVALQPQHHERGTPWWQRHRLALIWTGLVLAAFAAAAVWPVADIVKRGEAFTLSAEFDAVVEGFIVLVDPATQVLRLFLIRFVFIPLQDFYLWLPFTCVLGVAAAAGWAVGGLRSALVTLTFAGLIAMSGWWDRAMITAYMVTFAVLISTAIGLPLGIWAARSERRANAILLACDTAQTFPSFIYLIPVVMLFGVNDVAAIGAVIVFGMVPMTRYTIEGLRGVPVALTEAADMSGANARQKLVSVRLPLALPTIAVGLNQTVMFSLFMVIIAAFIGTRDLGQEMQRALSATDVGKGLVLGLCVAFMGLLIDHVIVRWSSQRKKDLGID